MKATILKQVYVLLLVLAIGLSFWLPVGHARNAAIGGVIGGILGFITNWLVIWMLFHPKKAVKIPPWLGGIGLPMTPGIMVEKQAVLADAIGRTVSTKLLNLESIRQELESSETQSSVTSSIQEGIDLALDMNLPPLVQLLDRDGLRGVLKAKPRLVNAVTITILDQINKPVFRDIIVELLHKEMERLSHQPLQTWLSASQREQIARWVSHRIKTMIEGEDGQRFIKNGCYSMGLSLAVGDSRSIEDLRYLSTEFLEPVIPQFIDASLSSMKERFNGSEMDKKLRSKIIEEIHSAIKDAVVAEIPFLVVPENLIDGFCGSFVEDRVHRQWEKLTSQVFESRDIRRFLVAEVNNAVERSFTMMTSGGGDHSSRTREITRAIAGTASRKIAEAIDYQEVENLIFQTLTSWCEQSLSDLLPSWRSHVDERVEDFVRKATFTVIQSGQAPLARAIDDLFDKLIFETRLGRLKRFLPNGYKQNLTGFVAKQGYQLILDKGPQLAKHISIEEIVRNQIMRFKPEQVESTIRDVANNELKSIILLGGFLGLIGGALLQPLLLILT